MEFYLKYLRHILALLLCVTLMLPMTACEKKENNGFVDITLNEVLCTTICRYRTWIL